MVLIIMNMDLYDILTQHCPAKRQSQVHRANEPMLIRHLRRCPNNKTALGQCIAFAWETQCH